VDAASLCNVAAGDIHIYVSIAVALCCDYALCCEGCRIRYKELDDVYASSNIRMIKSPRMK
jgi:hypothetical protein